MPIRNDQGAEEIFYDVTFSKCAGVGEIGIMQLVRLYIAYENSFDGKRMHA